MQYSTYPILAVASLALAPLFTDHMVLQRGQSNPIWGWDASGDTVHISVEGAEQPVEVEAKIDENGKWRADIPELPVGGRYTVHVKDSDETVDMQDVLVGEVWLASGQSNMEFPLSRAMNAKLEIETANNDQIRVIKVQKVSADEPKQDFQGKWNVASPQNAPGFTAVGYFFARDLAERLDVPVGIIDSTWGGTRVEAWTSRDALMPLMPKEELVPSPEREKKFAKDRKEYQRLVVEWEKEAMPQEPENTGFGKGYAEIDFSDSGWKTMQIPEFWETSGNRLDGVVWFRKTISIPQEWAGKDLQISLGAIDDYDITYFNGEEVGDTERGVEEAYQKQRQYTVPGKLVKQGKAVIAVRVFDQYGEGGFSGPASAMQVSANGNTSDKISLAGPWSYKVEHDMGLTPSDVYNTAPSYPENAVPQNQAAALFNGMINPLIPYGMRGVIWYQGEANANSHSTYAQRIQAMIRDWRTRWNQGNFTFLYVQLANWKTNQAWPWVREAQDAALQLPNTGRALALDIGNPDDIHPINKQEVGRRLALQALQRVYGYVGFEIDGPVIGNVEFEGGKAIVSLYHEAGLHTSDMSDTVKGFELAGDDGVYYPATGKIEGGKVIVQSDEVPQPEDLRYAWANNPVVNLVNIGDLPAAPYRTDKFGPRHKGNSKE